MPRRAKQRPAAWMVAAEAHDRRAMREAIAAELLDIAARYGDGRYRDHGERVDAAVARDIYTASAMRVLTAAQAHGGALSELEAQAFVRERRTREAAPDELDP